MPIVVRRGRVIAEPRSRLLRFERPMVPTAAVVAVGIEPPGVVASAEPDRRHEIARLALDLVVRTSEPADVPNRWCAPAFGREVERTRAQLGPIRSRDALIASFSREASVAVTRASSLAPPLAGPVRVAYAIRWLELGDGRLRPSWASWIAGPVDDVALALGSVGLERADQMNGEIST